MEKINLEKREKIKKNLFIAGLIGLASIFPMNAIEENLNIINPSKQEQSYEKDAQGRIIKIISSNEQNNYNSIYIVNYSGNDIESIKQIQ